VSGSIKPGRAPGTWYLRVELPRNGRGRRQQRRETLRGTKADAQRRLRELIREVESGGHADGTRMRVVDLAERWLQSAQHRVGARTFTSYDAHLRLYIVPLLGSHRVDALLPPHIESALAAWTTGGRNDRQTGKLSQRTVAHIFNTLRTMCRWAVQMRLLVRNPVDAVHAPRVERVEMRALDSAGVAELIAAARGTELEHPIVVAVGTGLRRGELLGLRHSDIDLDAGLLWVRRSVETIKGVTRSKPPKTARSARTIALPTFVVDALRRNRTDQTQRRLILGIGRDEDTPVFTRADEAAWEPGAFSLAFARLVKRAKLRHVRFHDLRHSFGTLALQSGVDLKTVSSALGHSAISTTANVYLHAVESMQHEAAARINALLGASIGQALASSGDGSPLGSVPQRCHTTPIQSKNARQIGRFVVAPTGIEFCRTSLPNTWRSGIARKIGFSPPPVPDRYAEVRLPLAEFGRFT